MVDKRVSQAPLLRKLLLADAASCMGMGLLLILAAAPLFSLTAIPVALLFYAGLALLPIAVLMVIVALRSELSRMGVMLVVEGNALWVLASALLMLGPWITPNTIGYVFIGAQALFVAAIAVLEYKALQGLQVVRPA